jgi:septum formation protein
VFDLVLASASPRRRELLERLGVVFRVRAADIDETTSEQNPSRMVQHLALEKAKAVLALEPNALVLAADTTVAINNCILNKPQNTQENADFIRLLAGNWHEVHTGIALKSAKLETNAVEITRVKFRRLSEAEILGYAQSREGLDKAGGYGIQALGMALVEQIEGDYFNVVGLPVARLLETALAAGIQLLPWVLP